MIVAIAIAVFLLLPTGIYGEQVILEDFEQLPMNQFPGGWKVKKWLGYQKPRGDEPWEVRQEKGNNYLAAESYKDAVTIGRPVHYDLNRYPYLSWRWRVIKLPRAGNEGVRATSDSAAGIYLLFKKHRSIKYVWSATLESETIVSSPFWAAAKIIVVRSGRCRLGEWLSERRNVVEDYKRAFNTKNVPDTPKALAFLTDSDSTDSSAVAHYDDIVAMSK